MPRSPTLRSEQQVGGDVREGHDALQSPCLWVDYDQPPHSCKGKQRDEIMPPFLTILYDFDFDITSSSSLSSRKMFSGGSLLRDAQVHDFIAACVRARHSRATCACRDFLIAIVIVIVMNYCF